MKLKHLCRFVCIIQPSVKRNLADLAAKRRAVSIDIDAKSREGFWKKSLREKKRENRIEVDASHACILCCYFFLETEHEISTC